jgi:hypothetical protein
VIAVPTSIGYGANFGGVAALLGMLTSCGSGVTVVNIDNGFGAGYAAAQINAETIPSCERGRAETLGCRREKEAIATTGAMSKTRLSSFASAPRSGISGSPI